MTRLAGQVKQGVAPVGRLFDTLRQILMGVEPDSNGTAPALRVRVRCGRCGEEITVRVDKANDLEGLYADEPVVEDSIPHPIGYSLHKEVVGRRCQNLIRFTMQFDDHRRVIKEHIEGGEFLGWEDTR